MKRSQQSTRRFVALPPIVGRMTSYESNLRDEERSDEDVKNEKPNAVQPLGLTEENIKDIVIGIQGQFSTFGGVRRGDNLNPITHWMEGKPATFAAGVDIKDVVHFVIGSIEKLQPVPKRKVLVKAGRRKAIVKA